MSKKLPPVQLFAFVSVTALIVALFQSPASATTRHVMFHRVVATMAQHPIVQLETVKTTVALKQAGWVLHNSDNLHPMAQNVPANSTTRFRLKFLKCGEAVLEYPYAITKHGRFILGNPVSLFRSCPTHFGAHVNQACPSGVKKFVRIIRASDGAKFTWGGMSHLVLFDGTVLNSRIYVKDAPTMLRLVYWAPADAKLDTAHPARSTAFLSPYWGASVASDRVHMQCKTSGYVQ